MSILEFRYLKHGESMPDGYELRDNLQGTHHGHFAVLIVEKDGNRKRTYERKKSLKSDKTIG